MPGIPAISKGPPSVSSPLCWGTLRLGMMWSIFVFAMYVYTMYPSVPGGDSGELIAAACTAGVAHPPGYPLWILLSRVTLYASSFLIPESWNWTPAYILNLSSAIYGSFATLFIYLAILLWCRDDRQHGSWQGIGGALAGSGLWAFTHIVWDNHLQAEVFALNNMLVAFLVYATVYIAHYYSHVDSRYRAHRMAIMGAVVIGVGLGNQHTLVLYAIPFSLSVALVYLVHTEGTYLQTLLSLLSLVGFVLSLFLAVHALLMLPQLGVVDQDSAVMWGDLSTLHGIVSQILRADYGTFNLGGEGDVVGPTVFLTRAINDWLSSAVHSSVVAWLAVIGCAATATGAGSISTSRQTRIALSLVAIVGYIGAISLYLAVFARGVRAAFFDKFLGRGLLNRFWMQLYILLYVYVGIGWNVITRIVWSVAGLRLGPMSAGSQRMYQSVVIGTAVALVASQVQSNLPMCQHRYDTIVRDYGLSMLTSVPKRSIIVTRGEVTMNPIVYLQQCEGVRLADVATVDQEIMGYEWFIAREQNLAKRVLGASNKGPRRRHRVLPRHRVVYPGAFYRLHQPGFSMADFVRANQEFHANHAGGFEHIYIAGGIKRGDDTWMDEYELWQHGYIQELRAKTNRSADIMSDIARARESLPSLSIPTVTVNENGVNQTRPQVDPSLVTDPSPHWNNEIVHRRHIAHHQLATLCLELAREPSLRSQYARDLATIARDIYNALIPLAHNNPAYRPYKVNYYFNLGLAYANLQVIPNPAWEHWLTFESEKRNNPVYPQIEAQVRKYKDHIKKYGGGS